MADAWGETVAGALGGTTQSLHAVDAAVHHRPDPTVRAVKGAREIPAVSWDEAWGVKSRPVARGQARKEARPIAYTGVDEKAFRMGHRYHTIVCDLGRSTVELVAEERTTASLAAYYAQLTETKKRHWTPSRWICGTITSRRPARACRWATPRSCSIAYEHQTQSGRLPQRRAPRRVSTFLAVP